MGTLGVEIPKKKRRRRRRRRRKYSKLLS